MGSGLTESGESAPPGARPEAREIRGVLHYPGWLGPAEQAAMADDVAEVMRRAPPFSPMTPWGRPMRVRMTSAGRVGWVSDRRGYRYAPHHPEGMAWPAIPASVLAVWDAVARRSAAEDSEGMPEAAAAAPGAPAFRRPDCCLVNHYGEGVRMGLHQDRDEKDFSWPVVSISLGDDALFRIGNLARGGATESLWLRSGDVLVMGGSVRLIHHGIDRIAFGSSPLLPEGGRVNLTLRVVG